MWIKVPDLRRIALLLVNEIINGYEAARLIYASQDYPENTHRNGFTHETLRGELFSAGAFQIVIRSMTGNDANNLEALAVKV